MNSANKKSKLRSKTTFWYGGAFGVVALISPYVLWDTSQETALAASIDTSHIEGTAEPPRVVRTVSVKQVTDRKEKTYPGTVHAKTSAQMAFRVGGPLVEVNVKPGDEVEAGQVLMRIDPRDFENRVAAAEAALESAKAKQLAMHAGARNEDIQMLTAKKLALDARKANLRAEFNRNAQLIVDNAVSRAEYEGSEAALKEIENELVAAAEELKKAKAGARAEDRQAMAAEIKALEVQLKTAQHQLDDTVLRAPFDGTISKQLVENFEPVGPDQEVLVIHDISSLEIHVALPEKDVIRRSFDGSMQAKVRLLASPETELVANFKELDTDADPLTRTYQVTFQLDSTSSVNIFPGMVAEVEILQPADRDLALQTIVPTQAVLGGNSSNQFVWILDNSQVRKQLVELGDLIGANQQVIQSGLNEGDKVVVAGGSFLVEGEKVTTYRPAK